MILESGDINFYTFLTIAVLIGGFSTLKQLKKEIASGANKEKHYIWIRNALIIVCMSYFIYISASLLIYLRK